MAFRLIRYLFLQFKNGDLSLDKLPFLLYIFYVEIYHVSFYKMNLSILVSVYISETGFHPVWIK